MEAEDAACIKCFTLPGLSAVIEPVRKQTGRFEAGTAKRSRADHERRAAIAVDVARRKGTRLDHVFEDADRLSCHTLSLQRIHPELGLRVDPAGSRMGDTDRARHDPFHAGRGALAWHCLYASSQWSNRLFGQSLPGFHEHIHNHRQRDT